MEREILVIRDPAALAKAKKDMERSLKSTSRDVVPAVTSTEATSGQKSVNTGIVTVRVKIDSLNVRAEPNKGSRLIDVVHKGDRYAARRDFTNAIKEFTNAIQKQPSYAAAYSNRGVSYMQQNKFDLAEDDLKKAIELGPKDGKNHYNLACWYSLQNQTGRGLVSLDNALANGFNDYNSLRKDRDLANLRKSPDWQKVLDKHKIFLNGGN
jgi:tetratricopeptide (TPR) repeat protein